MKCFADRMKCLIVLICMFLFPQEAFSQMLTEEEVTLIMEEPTVRKAFEQCAAKGPHPESIELFYIVDKDGKPSLVKTEPEVNKKIFKCFWSVSKMVVFSATANKYELSYPMDLPPPYEGKPAKVKSKPSAKSRKLKLAGSVTLGLGGAFLLGATISGALSLLIANDLEEKCPDNVCAPRYRGTIDKMNSLAIAVDVLIVFGAAASAAGIVLLVLGRKVERKQESAPQLTFAPPAGMVLTWKF